MILRGKWYDHSRFAVWYGDDDDFVFVGMQNNPLVIIFWSLPVQALTPAVLTVASPPVSGSVQRWHAFDHPRSVAQCGINVQLSTSGPIHTQLVITTTSPLDTIHTNFSGADHRTNLMPKFHLWYLSSSDLSFKCSSFCSHQSFPWVQLPCLNSGASYPGASSEMH